MGRTDGGRSPSRTGFGEGGWVTAARQMLLRMPIALFVAISLMVLAHPAAAQACSGPGDFGTQYLSSSWPGGFTGVPVYSDGGGYVSNCYDYVASPGGASIKAGMEWQCVELVNRLYISRGWISSTWWGNGDQLYFNAPGNLSKEAQGSISHLAPGDVISFTGPVSGDGGHAAVVSAVSGSSITLVNQNTSSSNTISTGTLSNGSLIMNGWAGYTPIGAIHAPGGGGVPADGTFVSYQGNVYRMAGGAPLYVSNWAVFGGPQPTVALSAAQWNSLRPYPADGTLISTTQDGRVYRIAGGAPLYVSTWNAVGGPQPSVAVDQWDVDNTSDSHAHLPQYPANGTFITTTQDGRVYRIAGGAPLYVSTWNAVGGPQPSVAVDQWDVDNTSDAHAHLRQYPANGTFITTTQDGRVYRIAGGAPLYVSTWNAVGGPQPSVAVDQWDVDNTSDSHAHLLQYPANGTFITTTQDGRVYRIAGGAPLYVSTWNAVGGPQPSVAVDQWDVDNTSDAHAHLRQYPADGTFINTFASHVYRFAGGAPFLVSSWSIFGGTQPSTTVDQWDVDNRFDPHTHVRPAPADGTIVEGLPSASYWSFSSGYRSPTSANGSDTTVDDVGLAAYPQTSTGGGGSGSTGGSGGNGGAGSTGGSGGSGGSRGGRPHAGPACIVPRLRHMTLRKARGALQRAHCRLGRIHRPRHMPHHHVLSVVSQSARARSSHRNGYAVNIVMR